MGSGTQNGTRLEPTPHSELNRLVGKNGTQFRQLDCKLHINTLIHRLKPYITKFWGFETPKWVQGLRFARDWNTNLTPNKIDF